MAVLVLLGLAAYLWMRPGLEPRIIAPRAARIIVASSTIEAVLQPPLAPIDDLRPWLPTSQALPTKLRVGPDIDAELDRGLHQSGARAYVEWKLLFYAALDPCLQPRVWATRPALYIVYVDVDDAGLAEVSLEADRHPWMSQGWTDAEAAELGAPWTGSAWTEDQLDALDECTSLAVAAHHSFNQPDVSWWGQRWIKNMTTPIPVWRSDIYRFAVAP